MGLEKPIEQIKPEAPVHDVVQEKPVKYTYGQIFPHELSALAPLIIDFYKEIGFKEAAETPGPFIQEIFEEMSKNPYSIIYACADRDMEPQGYLWLRVDRDLLQRPFTVIEHDYIIPEHRGTLREATIHRQFIEFVVQTGERCRVQYMTGHVRTKKLEEHWIKLGFRSIAVRMEFKGNMTDFRERNLGFQQFGKHKEET
jgi:hypothetical protein